MEVEPGPFVQLNNQGVCGSLGLNEIDYVDFFVIGVRDSISAGWMRREHKGRAYYLVEFPYDPNYEYFHAGFAARVYFWADTGIVFQVVFGNGWGFVEIDQPEKYKDQERIMEYERQPPKKQEE